MRNTVPNILNKIINTDPIKEMNLVRSGLKTDIIESVLDKENLLLKDILTRLDVPSSTYFAKKKKHQPLDTYTTEKFVRLFSVLTTASKILGKEEAKEWLYRTIPSLGNEAPIDLLDTEIGHRLVEQTLLQIKYGMYG